MAVKQSQLKNRKDSGQKPPSARKLQSPSIRTRRFAVSSQADGAPQHQVTIDVYGHLIPGENVEWIDALDRASEKVSATDANRTQTQDKDSVAGFSDTAPVTEGKEVIWCPPGIRTPIC